ncbi:MAG: hypothetical protein JW985_00070 [Alphaproteobacteria bacterium]|nr:hypothetical protein [Alphaproteobacteria bacterium]
MSENIVYVAKYRTIGNLNEQIMVPANQIDSALNQYNIALEADPRTVNMEKFIKASKSK